MQTRERTKKLWLLDKSPPIFYKNVSHGFAGSLPPTGEQVLLQYFGYFNCVKKLLTDSRRQWGRRAAALAVEDLEKWWERTGIAIKSRRGLEKMIVKTVNDYTSLKKSLKRKSVRTQENNKKFKRMLSNTFWAVCSVTEKILERKSKSLFINSREKEDYQYLMNVKGNVRVGVLGGYDKKLDDSVKDMKNRREAMSRKRKREDEERENNAFILDSVEYYYCPTDQEYKKI